MKIKKGFLSLMALMLVSLMIISLPACGGQNAGTGDTTTGGGTEVETSGSEPVEITYWHMWTSDWQKWIEGVVDEFNKTHPNIKVIPQSIPSDAETKFLAATTGGNPPDVFTEWNAVIGTWANSGAIMPLDEFISEDAPNLKEYMFPIASKLGEYNGKTYAIPMDLNLIMIFWNKDMFKEAGLDPEKLPTTIEELDAFESKLWKYNSKGGIERIGFFPNNITYWAPVFGGKFVNSDNEPTPTDPGLVKTLEWFLSYFTAKGHNIKDLDAFNSSITTQENSLNPFVAGKKAFTIDGMWLLQDIEKYAPDMDFGVTPFPYPSNGGKANAFNVSSDFNVIPSNAKHPREAWEFVKWLTGYGGNAETAAKALAAGGNTPVAQEVIDRPEFQKFLKEKPVRHKFVEMLGSENNISNPILPYSQYYVDRLLEAEDRVLHGKQTPEEALKQVDEEVKKEAAKVKATN